MQAKTQNTDKPSGLAHSVVIGLTEDLASQGNDMYCDNFYSSPGLFMQLCKMGTGAYHLWNS